MVASTKYLTVLILFFQLLGYSKLHFFSTEYLKNIPARDVYGILDKIADIHGLSYGQTGQSTQIKALGKDPFQSKIFIDDIPLTNFNSGISNLSTLSLDRIDNIVLDDSPVNSSSINIYIYTKEYEMDEPVTEMIYRDAFYNHRNISMHLGQRFSENSSFLLYAEITDYMDYRESSDRNFKYPYQKQNYNLRIKLPKVFSVQPSIEFSYLKENIYDFSADSILNKPKKPETFRWTLNFDSIAIGSMNNKLSFINSLRSDYFDPDNQNFTVYDRFSYIDSTNIFKINSKLEFLNFRDLKGESVFSIEPSYVKKFHYLTTDFNSFLR